jgi:glycosyltransferase involved in cell wall biosynthesis
MPPDAQSPAISIVIPVYRSADVVTDTVAETLRVFRTTGDSFEIILVNDGSPDESWSVIRRLADSEPEVVAIDLLRNYGQHSAVLCGLDESRGEFVLTIDDDLQNPPSELPKMVDLARSGDHDLVVGEFTQKRHGFVRRVGSTTIASINKRVFGNPANITMSNVRCIRSDLVGRIVSYQTSKPYITGLCLKFSSDPVNIPVEHQDRAVGQSNYSPKAIVSLVLRILFVYSNWPLRFVSNLGMVVAVVSLMFGVFVLIRAIVVGNSIPGWASVVVLLSFFNGISILILAMLGEYTIRILNQVSSERAYLIREVVR